jgi:hypothetical protein
MKSAAEISRAGEQFKRIAVWLYPRSFPDIGNIIS